MSTSIITKPTIPAPPRKDTERPIVRLAVFGLAKSPTVLVRHLFANNGWCRADRLDLTADPESLELDRFDAAILLDEFTPQSGLTPPRHPVPDHSSHFHEILTALQKARMGTVILTQRPYIFAGYTLGAIILPPDATIDTIRGVLLALAHTRPVFKQIDLQLRTMQRLSRSLHRHFEGMDRELHLAARLQHEFLPKNIGSTAPLRFETCFRPSSWVSGDIFDIFRLDENHVGFYLFDVVGHGVAAGLLTIYIKHTIRPAQWEGPVCKVLPPAQVLTALNEQLMAQKLPDSQFVTGWYGLVDLRTLELTYSVAGHPPPMFVSSDRTLRELHGDGCVLGVNQNEAYADFRLSMRTGDRVLLYSDGLEETLIAHRPPIPAMPHLRDGIPELLRLPTNDLIRQLVDRLDNAPGSLTHSDDVSFIILDVEK